MSFYLINEVTDMLAHRDSRGEHDGKITEHCAEAARFDSWGDASDYGQNFGPDWRVEEY